MGKDKDKGKTKSAGETETVADFVIKPTNEKPEFNAKDWPILLKNYDKLNVRTGHYTPLPDSGFSPLKRPIKVIYFIFIKYLLGIHEIWIH